MDTEDCSPQDDNENENILDHENVDDKGGIDAMYDYTLNNFRILTTSVKIILLIPILEI